MSSWSDEVQASVDAEVDFIPTTRLLLLQHVRLMLVIQEFDDWHPRIAIVNIVAEAGSIDDRQTD